MDEGPDGLKLISEVIREKLGIKMSVLMGANIANEVADDKFCETTIGEADEKLCEYQISPFLCFGWLYAFVCFMFVRLQGSSSRGIA